MHRFAGLLVFGLACFLGGALASSQTAVSDNDDVAFGILPCKASRPKCDEAALPTNSTAEPTSPLLNDCLSYPDAGKQTILKNRLTSPINIAARTSFGYNPGTLQAHGLHADGRLSLKGQAHYFVVVERCSSVGSTKERRITTQILRFPKTVQTPTYETQRSPGA